MQHKVSVAPRADILIHVVPVEVFEFFGCEVNARYFVSVMVRSVEAISIIHVDGAVRMSRSVARNFDLRTR